MNQEKCEEYESGDIKGSVKKMDCNEHRGVALISLSVMLREK